MTLLFTCELTAAHELVGGVCVLQDDCIITFLPSYVVSASLHVVEDGSGMLFGCHVLSVLLSLVLSSRLFPVMFRPWIVYSLYLCCFLIYLRLTRYVSHLDFHLYVYESLFFHVQ